MDLLRMPQLNYTLFVEYLQEHTKVFVFFAGSIWLLIGALIIAGHRSKKYCDCPRELIERDKSLMYLGLILVGVSAVVFVGKAFSDALT